MTYPANAQFGTPTSALILGVNSTMILPFWSTSLTPPNALMSIAYRSRSKSAPSAWYCGSENPAPIVST